jgi:hypothetical protein
MRFANCAAALLVGAVVVGALVVGGGVRAASRPAVMDYMAKAGFSAEDLAALERGEAVTRILKKDLGAVVCDILAFRPDQTVAGLFRGWEKDRPGLNFFLVFSSDDPAEAERASRVPQSLTAGRLSRPIDGKELIEKLQVMVQRQSASKS